MAITKELEDKIITGYLTSELTPSQQAANLHVGRKLYEQVVKDNVEVTTVTTREQAWALFKEKEESTAFFYRALGISRIQAPSFLINLVMPDSEIEELVTEGLTVETILQRINMPVINLNILHRYLAKQGIKYDLELSRKNTGDTIKERWKDPEWARGVQEKKVATTMARLGVENPFQDETVKEKVRVNNLYARATFTPTVYVPTLEHSTMVLEREDTLRTFLNTNFPEKEKFSIGEISDIVGRSYATIHQRFGTSPDFIKEGKHGNLPRKVQTFLEELGYTEGVDFLVNDRQAIKPLEIDFYFPEQKVGIEVNDLLTHNSTYNPYTNDRVKPKNYHMEKSRRAKEQGIRLIHAWEHYFNDPQQYEVLKNAIKHALGISKYRVYARNTYVKEVPNKSLKDFFNTNNIQGFRGAKTAYALFDKKTDEVLMAYSVGASHFAHNKYDMELIRGASKLDTTIVGGASKLWKFIIDSNPEVNSIVYYIDRNIYNGSSISTLEGNLELVSTQVGFWNYFVETEEMKNRQPAKHKEIKELVAQGKVWEVYNAGTETYVWTRS